MIRKNTEGDNWGQLLSEFGIEHVPQGEVQPRGALDNHSALDNHGAPDHASAPDHVRQDDERRPGNSSSQDRTRQESLHSRSASGLAEMDDSSGFGLGLLDSPSDTRPTASTSEDSSDPDDRPKEKKSIFSRFPKINFFGASPQVLLDSDLDQPKSFTDNKLETMPISQELPHRQRKERQDAQRHTDSRRIPADEQQPDAWSAVASQIGVIARRDEVTDADVGPSPERSNDRQSDTRQSDTRQSEKRGSRRVISSMFDDPIPESDEVRTLKNMMGTPPETAGRDAVPSRSGHSRGRDIPRDAFHDSESEPREFDSRGRGRRMTRAEYHSEDDTNERTGAEERAGRGRGARYRPSIDSKQSPGGRVDGRVDRNIDVGIVESDFVGADFEMIEERGDRPTGPRGRGRRGGQYDRTDYQEQRYSQNREQREEHQEEWSEVDVALQAGSGGHPVRTGRRQYDKPHQNKSRYDRSRGTERIDRDSVEERILSERPIGSRSLNSRDDNRDNGNLDNGNRDMGGRDADDDMTPSVVAFHGDVPSWDDAVGGIISGNMTKHRTTPGHSGRGRR